MSAEKYTKLLHISLADQLYNECYVYQNNL